MKFVLIIAVIALAGLSLGACATTSQPYGYGYASGPAPRAPQSVRVPHCYTSAPPSGGCVGND